ncbi:MAG TPA: hypothetical protein VM537_10320 [Anaerolineae bacterium]|nr:hypothetical protein [Anaerolineae bacterium]
MSVLSKVKFTGSTGGHGILITDGATAGQVIHTPHATDTDEVWLWATNVDTTGIDLTIEFGNTTDPITQTIIPGDGLQLVIPGLATFADATVIAAFAATTSKVSVFGYVIRETA